ncbi:MAG: hypothetical protein Q8R17_00535, partial [bacterium]|nr:hypothetical protein [bacterium]
MIDGISSPPFSATTLPPIAPPKESFKAQVIAASRRQFAIPRVVVEEKIKVWHAPTAPTPPPAASQDRRLSPSAPPQDNRGKGYWQERKNPFQPRANTPPPPLPPRPSPPIPLQSLERKSTVPESNGKSALRDALADVLSKVDKTSNESVPRQNSGRAIPSETVSPEEVKRVLREGLPPEPSVK